MKSAKGYKRIIEERGILENIYRRLEQKAETKGDSWINTDLFYMRERVDVLYKEYKSRERILDLEQKGLLDLINQSILLLLRLKAKKNFLKEFE